MDTQVTPCPVSQQIRMTDGPHYGDQQRVTWRRAGVFPKTPYLKDDPVTLLGSQVESLFSNYLLTLSKGNIVEIPVVKCITKFLP